MLSRTEPEATGYSHPSYAASLSEFGSPCRLPDSDGWLLKRQIGSTPYHDAIGPYPFFTCASAKNLAQDVERLKGRLVSVTLITDPFGSWDPLNLRRCFPDRMVPFKEHFVIDLRSFSESALSSHHKRYLPKALRAVRTALCDAPAACLSTWIDLYEGLIRRHEIRGISAFSPTSFEQQLKVPGIVAFKATCDGAVVGMILWYISQDKAYYHLAAYSEQGYRLRASYALFWESIQYFQRHGTRWLGLGSGAGVQQAAPDGLTRFKRGWATGTRTVYLCGRILEPDVYRGLAEACGVAEEAYFPAYRVGEFGNPN